MKIGIISDLHLNWIWSGNIDVTDDQQWEDKMFFMLPDADILIIAGDLCDDTSKAFSYCKRSWMKDVSKRYKYVFFVLGNHDYYGTSLVNLEQKLESLIQEQGLTNVFLLQNDCFEIPNTNTLVIGGTLWTDYANQDPLTMMNASFCMNDYRQIRDHKYSKITAERLLREHYKTKQFIDIVARENRDKELIVITHHLPSYSLCNRDYDNQNTNAYYASNLDQLILDNENIKCWVSGHSHQRKQLYIGQCLCMMNAFGYAGSEAQGYQPMVFEI